MPVLNFPPSIYEQSVTDGTTRYVRRLDVYENDGVTLWESNVPIVSGSVTADQTREERRSATLVLYNEDDRLRPDRGGGFWYDKILKLYMGVEVPSGYWETGIGVFMIDRMGTSADGYTMNLSLRDKSKKLKFGLPFTLTYPENTPVENIITDLAAAAGIGAAERNLPLTGVNTDTEITLERDKNRFTAMTEIANVHGFELWFDVDGVLQMTVFEDPTLAQLQYVFQTGALSNLAKIDRTATDTLIRNHVVVYGEQARSGVDTTAPAWGEALNNTLESPTRVQRLGLRTVTYKSEWVTNSYQAEILARNLLKYEALEQFDCNLETVIVPWLEPGIIVELNDPAAGVDDPTRFLLSSLTINLDLSPATAVVKRVSNVDAQYSTYPDTTLYPDLETFPNIGAGRDVWLYKVRRSWTAWNLPTGFTTWPPERGPVPLIITANGPVSNATTTGGHPAKQFPASASVATTTTYQGARYIINGASGNLVAELANINGSTTLDNALINGLFDVDVPLSAQELSDISDWLTYEKFQ